MQISRLGCVLGLKSLRFRLWFSSRQPSASSQLHILKKIEPPLTRRRTVKQ